MTNPTINITATGVLPAFAEQSRRVAQASADAMRDVATEARLLGRANIRDAGMGTRFANALRVTAYPRRGGAVSPAAFIKHNAPYSSIFENGGTIPGSPLLWLPLPEIKRRFPVGRGGRRMPPGRYVVEVGPLVFRRRSGRPPLLMGRPDGGALVPLYIGIKTVHIPKHLNIVGMSRRAAALYPEFFAVRLRGD